ncbi:hypothetical protein AB1L42_23390 [Thalassoglobus sp. JC818]|uniref:hypothetical protein n=1 Tax=Thalassoglobus sp. JC818 TaxID=3232136 RepID=UPI003457B40D
MRVHFQLISLVVLLSLTCCETAKAEPELNGDQGLRERILDAIATSRGMLETGHWKGTVLFLSGADGEVPTEEIRGTAEVIWDKDRTYRNFEFDVIDRTPPESRPHIIVERFESEGKLLKIENEKVVSEFVEPQPMHRPLMHEQVRPDELWFKLNGTYDFEKFLHLENQFKVSKLLSSQVSRLRDGRIAVLHIYIAGQGKTLTVRIIADPKQGLHPVEWSYEWYDQRRTGKASWDRTDAGVWYPKSFEYQSSERFPIDAKHRWNLNFRMETTEFKPRWDKARDPFSIKPRLEPGMVYYVIAANGKRVSKRVIGKPEEKTPEETHDRLTDQAKEDFAAPSDQEQ